MNSETVNVVVTCTARKTQKAPRSLMMRGLRQDHLESRFKDWRARFANSNLKQKHAIDLYCGNAWSIIRDLVRDTKTGAKMRLWIVSAGHGLVSPNEMLSTYGATFASGEEDSVVPARLAKHSVSEWWDLLVKNRRQEGIDVACIADIAAHFPNEPIVLALSSDYLQAVSHDLESACSKMVDADRLIIIAAGSRKTGTLADNFLPCDSRLEHHFGRSRMTLNARILKMILTDFSPKELRATRLKSHFKPLLAGLPKATYPERKPADDLAVCRFILKKLLKSENTAYTALLRLFRSTGYACEQKRFKGLFRAVVAEMTNKG